MKDVVTGGSGFLGSELVRTLLSRGRQVTVIARSEPPEEGGGAEFAQGSVLDTEHLARSFARADTVYHLAGVVEHSRRPGVLPRARALHVDGTRTVIEAAASAGVRRVVYASTSGTVGASKDSAAIADDSAAYAEAVVGRWPYYRTKIDAEVMALQRSAELGVELVAMRPTLIVGPGDRRLSSTQSVVDFLRGEVPVVPPGGLSLVDVRDAAAAFIAASTDGRSGATYLLGANNMPFNEYFAHLARLSGCRAPRLTLPWGAVLAGAQVVDRITRPLGRHIVGLDPVVVEMSRCYWYIDSNRAAAELGAVNRRLDATLGDTIAWIRERGLDR